MTREQFCQKYNLTEKQFTGEEWVRRDLTIYEEFLPEGFNPKVTGNLSLPNLKITPLWFNPVAWRVWFNGYNKFINKFRPENEFYSWRDGQYIRVDNIITEVVKQRGKVFHVKPFGDDKLFYLVTDGNGTYAHGDTLSEAKADLKFKLAKREGIERYRSLTLESVLSFDELIAMYRLITGACQFGVKKFIKDNKVENKSYSIGEFINLTDGYYGSGTFKKFFTKNLVD